MDRLARTMTEAPSTRNGVHIPGIRIRRWAFFTFRSGDNNTPRPAANDKPIEPDPDEKLLDRAHDIGRRRFRWPFGPFLSPMTPICRVRPFACTRVKEDLCQNGQLRSRKDLFRGHMRNQHQSCYRLRTTRPKLWPHSWQRIFDTGRSLGQHPLIQPITSCILGTHGISLGFQMNQFIWS